MTVADVTLFQIALSVFLIGLALLGVIADRWDPFGERADETRWPEPSAPPTKEPTMPDPLATLAARVEAFDLLIPIPAPPLGTRLVLVAEGMLDQWGGRTFDGYAITAEWGERRPEGWWEPMFTIHYDQPLAPPPDVKRLREAIIRAVAGIDGYSNPDTTPGGWWDRHVEPVFRAALEGADHAS